jgi:signal transduction histidine kinase
VVLLTPLVPPLVRTTVVPAVVVVLATNAYFLVLIRRRRRLQLVGYVGAAMDVMMMCAMPLTMYRADLVGDGSPLLVMKTHMPTACAAVIALNGVAARPAYPALVAAGCVAIHFALLALGFGHTQWSVPLYPTMTGPYVAPHVFGLTVAFLSAEGLLLALYNRRVRRMVVEAAESEAQRVLEQQRQAQLVMDAKMDALVKLVAGVSHELNTPLGSVRSGLATQRKALTKLRAPVGEDPKKRERVLGALDNTTDASEQAVERMIQVVERLKAFARVDEAAFKKADVGELVRDALALVPAAARRGLPVELELADDVPELECYPALLSQALLTLISNAFEAIDEHGGVSLQVTADDDAVEVVIADDGRGMPPERVAELFDVGFGHSDGRVSAGFGLPICHNVVQQHGGTIAVESEPGEGTTFRIRLPR